MADTIEQAIAEQREQGRTEGGVTADYSWLDSLVDRIEQAQAVDLPTEG